jgi:hypothetical protein
MNRPYEIFKTPSGQSTGKALLNHTIFSLSQTGETVPLILAHHHHLPIEFPHHYVPHPRLLILLVQYTTTQAII